MDFDLHFGMFFGPQIEVFEKFLLPDFELQLEVRSAKIMILPKEIAIFFVNWHCWFEMGIHEKYEKSGGKSFRNKFVFWRGFFKILEPTWVDFGAKLGLQQMART